MKHPRQVAALVLYGVFLFASVAAPRALAQSNSTSQAQSTAPGAELAQETRAAEGEDENGKLKQSAAVALVGRITGLGPRAAYWVCVLVNFVVIALVIWWFSRKSLPEFFRGRTLAIQKALEEARQASEDARRRLSEIEARLSRLDADLAEMRAAAEKEVGAEEERIRTAALEEAKHILASAEQEIQAAAKAARRELTAYAADLAVGLAGRQIRVDGPTDQNLVRNFAQQLSNDSGAAGKGAR